MRLALVEVNRDLICKVYTLNIAYQWSMFDEALLPAYLVCQEGVDELLTEVESV